MKNWIKIILSFLGGILYRLGGAGNVGDKFDFLRNTLTRDIGMCLLIGLLLFPGNFWGIFLSMGFTYGASTLGYGGSGEPPQDQSDLYRLFGKYVFFAVGLIFGLALLPFAISEHLTGNIGIWKPFLLRTGLLTFLIPFIHHFRRPLFGFDSAQVEEFLRGFTIAITCLVF